jgi:hypothetical protein
LDCELPVVDVGLVAAVVDENNELEILVPLVVADEVELEEAPLVTDAFC